MPCNTIIKVTLKLKRDTVVMDMLREVVETLGYRVTRQTETLLVWTTGSYSKESEEITERSESSANMIRQTYAAKLVESKFRRFGWKVTTQKKEVRA